ncbi:type I restriction-modification enzyme S subunit [Acetobacter aceti NRIC 0242]|uniref:Type I restriction modification DNA specificity domain-containing protein n=1 Tax=Acetobacter aceti NBRC 14818 TaxID=887700 RepID=A0AB33ICV1_ACEAC|nr:restriction endonuclease subunit S [Acetobacter aceti]TCS30768.1 type I restriction enzyme S subunit [Acetobacter aceti NBRC 14818]BCK75913.1 hypothetical protein EMQ_1519 [Acetobacter aceti NBRC 14818]GAN58514.1 type I restriction-modification methylase S subunit [Acetobacter aceti NBRC 14818]GBO80576.1 type I restriction-modification enzyme S subunit [Acetobacter aceti NRIC 0242]
MLLDDTDYPEDWPIMHLDRIAQRGSGHTPSKSHPEYWNGNIKWVSLADSYRLDAGYIFDTDKKISLEGIKNSSAVVHPAETVILSRDAGVGKSGITKEAMAVSQHFIAWNCNQTDKILPWFLYYTLQFHQKELERQAVGSTIKTIGLPFFKNLEIALPPLPEQKKIAAILSTWDRAIEGTEKLLANSQQQKKALMQQLLTGKKRLPGFMGEWKIHRLSDFFVRLMQRNISGNTNVVTISAQDGLVKQEEYFKKIVASDTLDGYFLLENGDFAYNKSYSIGYPMGAIKRLNRYDEGVVTPLYICFRLKPHYITNGDFFEFYFDSGLMNYKLTQIAHEGGRAHGLLNVKPADFMDLQIIVPSVDEQKAIAAVLTTADKEIATIKSDLSRLRDEKKALMQQLLTGKRRVKVDQEISDTGL